MTAPLIPMSRTAPDARGVFEAARQVAMGHLLVYPSDTVYGIACDACDPGAVKRVRRLKGCGVPRPFIVIVESLEAALALAAPLPEHAVARMRSSWPGPVTLVLPASSAAPAHVLSGDGCIALRVPADPLSQALLSACRIPLVSTSANPAGGRVPLSLDDIPRELLAGCDLVLDGGALPPASPSAVLRLSGDGFEQIRARAEEP